MADVGVKPRVLVMMATYNGVEYVEEQIESILAQEGVRVSLQISDDGSTDGTCEVCERIASLRSNVVFRRNERNKGVTRNFLDMVYEADSRAHDYFAFSDQDDYWMPEKLSRGIELLANYSGEPVLYYSDVCNVSSDLSGPETYDYRRFQRCQDSLATLLVTNWACGCTMVFNAPLCLMLQSRRPHEFHRLHDVWVHLVALSCARSVPDLGNSYIKRRITGRNVSGELQLGKYNFKRLRGMIGYALTPSDHYATLTAQELLSCWGDCMSDEDRRFVRVFANMRTSFSCRLRVACSGRFKMPMIGERVLLRFRILLNLI